MTQPSTVGAGWATYQVAVADVFREAGVAVTVNDTVHGVRTDHDVDVAVRFRQLGSAALWIVECKLWRTRVTKLHVLALRTIVADIGAERGIILAERGFQRGAIEAARATNIGLMSLAELKGLVELEVAAAGLRDLADRVDRCDSLYRSMPKEHRIAHGLRPEVGAAGPYSATAVVSACGNAITMGLRNVYPILPDPMTALVYPATSISAAAPRDLLVQLRLLVDGLEARLRETQATEDPASCDTD